MMNKVRIFILIAAVCSGVLLVAFKRDWQQLGIRSDAPVVSGEKYMVVIIPSYNNIKWYKANLQTLFDQQYQNYKVIYIDDCSTDGTYEAVKTFIAQSGHKDRTTLIKNETRKGALYNLYNTIHSCSDKAIILTIDGDDWLHGTEVLQTINKTYDDPNIWMTYGQFVTYPDYALGLCHEMPAHIIKERSYRKQQDWFVSHLRTFYAGLFKKIKEEDLKLKGEFFSMTWDRAFLYPMMEMADGRIKFIDKVIYIYNQANPLNDFKTNVRYQIYCRDLIQGKELYEPLSEKIAASFCIT